MIINTRNRTKVSYTLLRVVWKLLEIDGKTRRYGTDVPLHEAEIHMLKAIRDHEGIHVTGLAEMLGVTKGAVSQIVMKLQKKGMVAKHADPGNLSRLVLRLTAKGETAYLRHEQLHQEFDNMVNRSLEGATEENRAFLKQFLDSLEKQIDGFEGNDPT